MNPPFPEDKGPAITADASLDLSPSGNRSWKHQLLRAFVIMVLAGSVFTAVSLARDILSLMQLLMPG